MKTSPVKKVVRAMAGKKPAPAKRAVGKHMARSSVEQALAQREAELALLNSVQSALAAHLDIHGIYEAVGEKLREIFDYQDGGIYSFDLKTHVMTIEYAFEKGRKMERLTVPMNSMWEFILAADEYFVFNGDFPQFAAQFKDYQVTVGELPKSALAVPVPRKKDADLAVLLGMEDVDGKKIYTESDVCLLQTLANSMSVALENARLFDETQQRNAELAVINSVQEGLASKLELNAIYELIGETIRKVFGAHVIDIVDYDAVNNLISMPYSYEEGDTSVITPIEPYGFRQQVIESGVPLLINQNFVELAMKNQNPLLTGAWPKSALFVPLLVKGRVRSIISIQDLEHENAYSTSDVQLLQTLANSMSVALENARLFDETQQRNAELAILNSVGEAMSKTLDVKTVTKIVGDKVRDIFSADQMGILLFEKQANLIHILYGYDKAHDRYLDSLTIKPLPLGKGLTSKVIESRQPLLLSTREEQDAYGHYMPPELAGQIKMSESWLGVPIMVEEEVLGTVFVEDYRPHAYTESHLRLLQTLSANMGVAIQNARLFDETQQRNAELAIINSVQEGLASKLEMQEIYELVGDKIREIFDANTVTLATFDLDKKMMVPRYLFEKGQRFFVESIPIPDIYQEFIQLGQPLLINDGLDEYIQRIDPNAKPLAGVMPKSVLAVPLTIHAKLHGVVTLQNIDRENAFSDSDVRLLTTLTNSMSVALENARLWEQEKLFRKALQRELEIGREIQQGFLPEALPRADGWEIAASLMSAREVAGDFYDAFELPDGTLGLVIADVCDKGVGAALFMTLFRSLIRAAANLDYFEQTENADAPHSPLERLQRAISLTNNYIAETHGESGMFATLFFGILDPRDGKMIYVNGGHESPLIVRADAAREALRRTGPAVGVVPNCKFDILETQLQAGDTFFAFTDGVPDCQNPRGEFFGRGRLHDLLREYQSAHGLVDAIQMDLRQYIGSASQFDDITLLAVRRLPQSAIL